MSAQQAKPMDAPAPANFGSVNVGSTSSPISITFTFDASATLGSIAVLTQGVPNLDFANAGTGTCSVGTAYSAGNSCTVDVAFAPTLAGTRYGAAVLSENSGSVIATGYIQGTGSGPHVNFLPGTESTIGSGINLPDGVIVDGSGNLYINDSNDGRVLEETWTGTGYTQSTFLSEPDPNVPVPTAVDGAGNLYIVDLGLNLAQEWTWTGSGYVKTTIGSGLYFPTFATVDGSGNVYIADAFNGRLLKESLTAGGYTQSVILTCGVYGIHVCPSSVAVDGSGNLYVSAWQSSSTFDSSKVLKMTPSASGYTQSTIGSGIVWDNMVIVDGTGNLFVADDDNGNSRILKETLSAGSYVQSTLPTSSLDGVYGVAVDGSGNVYIADTFNNRVLKEDLADPPSLSFTAANNGPQTVTIENVGNAPLIFPALSSGNNPSISTGFSLDSTASTACPVVSSGASMPATLAPGASCTLTIDVTPGTFTGTLVLADNNLNAAAPSYTTQTISLSSVAAKAAPTVTLTESAVSVPVGQPITLTATVTGVPGVSAPTGQVTFGTLPSGTIALSSGGTATWTSSTLSPGAYTVSANYSGDSNYSAEASAPVSFGVGRGSVNLAAISGQSWTGTYGATGNDTLCVAATNAAGSNLSGVTVTFSGTGLTFSPSSAVTGVNGQACSSITVPLSVGSYVASASATGVSSAPTFNLTVTPAPLTIRVSPNSISYGTANLDFIVNKVIGLVNGDTIGGTVTVTIQSGARPSSPIGYYPVSVLLGGSSAGNYSATVLPQQVHVRKALLQVFPYDLGVTYGQTPVLPNRYFFKGFVNGDTASVVSGAPTFATTVTSTTPVGIYRVTSSVGTLSAANYDFVMMKNVLEVYKAPLTLTANNITMQQGSAVPPLTYTLTGFVNGDTASVVTGAPILTTTATSSSPPGSYPITVAAGTLAAENYGVVNYGPAVTVTVVP